MTLVLLLPHARLVNDDTRIGNIGRGDGRHIEEAYKKASGDELAAAIRFMYPHWVAVSGRIFFTTAKDYMGIGAN